MVTIVVLGTIVNIMDMVNKGIMTTNINNIKGNIMITMATDIDNLIPEKMGIVTIEITGAINVVIIPAISKIL